MRIFWILLLISGVAQAGGIKKWQDENGQWHFGDAPPVAQATEAVSLPDHARDARNSARIEQQFGLQLYGNVNIGTPMEEVLQLWGVPDRKTILSRDDQRWDYAGRAGQYHDTSLYFSGGKVSKIENAPKNE